MDFWVGMIGVAVLPCLKNVENLGAPDEGSAVFVDGINLRCLGITGITTRLKLEPLHINIITLFQRTPVVFRLCNVIYAGPH